MGKTENMPNKSKVLTGKIIKLSINTLLRFLSGFCFLDIKKWTYENAI